jgi:signal transduction histidine kinase
VPGRLLRNIPIRRKVILIIMLATGGALLLAGAGLIASEQQRSRREMETDLQTLAVIIAHNSTAALSFSDPEAAQETLAVLRGNPPIAAAAIYGHDGQLFATYLRREGEHEPPARPGPDRIERHEASVSLFQPIVLKGERIGTVYLESDLSELYAQLRVQSLTITTIFGAAALAALVFSSGLQRVISIPVLELAGTARAISERKDYSLRARRRSGDELGRLVDAFNEMLEQIQQRDSELLKAKQELEQRVEERTVALRHELADRLRAEKELEEKNAALERSNQDLDDFAYIASHDLKEPLRGIHNFSVFLLEDYADKLDDEGRSRLETLIRLSRRMESLIDSLLHFSRLGRVDLAIDDVDLNGLVAEVVEAIDINLKEHRIDIRIPRPLPAVRCDRVRVRELYHNLIINAMKYNDKPEKWIEIGYSEKGAGGPPALYVRDNGIGIQEKHFDSIFRIFKRLHGRDKFGGGTGAGLTIVKKIVERHNGRIWVDSAWGEGTTIFFTLDKEA